MPIANAVTWDPTEKSDQIFKTIFDHLDASVDGVIFFSEQGGQDRFYLNSRGCFGVQTYVMTGRGFPKSADEFDRVIPKSVFQALSSEYPQLYDQTRNVVTQIGSICSDFFMNNLQGLAAESRSVTAYCDSTAELLAEAEGMNLRDQLNTLLNPKYKSASDLDGSYKDAKETAMMTLSLLKDEAQTKARDNERWSNEFRRFKESNERLQQDIKKILEPYMDGTGAARPVLALLDADSHKLLSAFSEALRAVRDRYNPWSKTESNPVTVVECGLGYIYMAQRAAQDPALRKAYGEFEARVEALRRDRPEVARLVTTISQLSLLEDMNDDADSAFAVLQGLHGFYQIQQTRFEFMQQKIDDLHQGVDNASLNTRQKWVLGEIDVIVQKLRQVKTLAIDYQRLMSSQTRLG